MSLNFCHIVPSKYLDIFATGRKTHLVLAHLVEEDAQYRNWYCNEKKRTNCTIILDNSAFEMYKRNLPMYNSDKLVEMAARIDADYVVMSDYPGEPAKKTEDKAEDMQSYLRVAKRKRFFCPQSMIGNVEELINSYMWAVENPNIDYIGLSILNLPNAYGVEKDNKLQRFLSRWRFCELLLARGFFQRAVDNKKKLHLLGMLDGPNEIWILKNFLRYFNTWDSSAAVWTGIHGIEFDYSPTGLVNGKFEKEVDFAYEDATIEELGVAMRNVKYIDNLLEKALNV
jgi:hypothetical protein